MTASKLMIALVALASTCAMAAPSVPPVRPNMEKHFQQIHPGKADFGVYRQVKTLRLQTSADKANGNMAVAEVAGMPIVKAEPSKILTRGSVVQNLLTGQNGVVTGRLTVLANQGVDVTSLANQYGLKVRIDAAKGGLFILDAPASTDLMALKSQLAASSGVKQVKIDVTDNRNVLY
ncbi:hypothetical protein [Gallaecimonas sp. GXIMD1310]|uniref:hypothetical protein n=1 Tax=Gallaecimonas sp. GXIMD1310 TaxID=3131926 RepID=UPI00324F39C5